LKPFVKKHAEKFRFGIVGIAATAIDFVILFSLVAMGLPAIAGNFVSTSVSMVFSFFTNKSFTFKVTTAKRHFLYFVIITIIGVWVIQPIIIEGVSRALGPWFTDSHIIKTFENFVGSWFKTKYVVLLFAKGSATAASLVWNYLMYRKYVFVKES
jgi:putative flippase GtrA